MFHIRNKNWHKRLKILSILFLYICMVPARALSADTPFGKHGLNLSSWLANAPRQPVFQRDFALIKDAGFDHVRLPFNPEYYGYRLLPATDTVSQMDFIPLDRALAEAANNGLPVILDLHPGEEFQDTLERHAWAENDFVTLWAALAERYKDIPTQELTFELLNEPQYYKTEDLWIKLSSRLIKTIHHISPERMIVVGAPHGSEIDGLSFLKTSQDPRLIYSFHFYEPYLVTHQGIHMGFEGKMIRYFRHMPYPSSQATEQAVVYAPDAPNRKEAKAEFDAYKLRPWNAETIASRIHIAKAWADDHKVRVICGEFGVLRNHIDPPSRYQWIADARKAFDEAGIGWELWDYTDLFGIALPVGATSTDPVDGSVRLLTPETGSRVFEAGSLDALGLRPKGSEENMK